MSMATSRPVFNHWVLADQWSKERAALEAHTNSLDVACAVYGTPRRAYRPVMGISGTLGATPNPCLERDLRPPPTLMPWGEVRPQDDEAPVASAGPAATTAAAASAWQQPRRRKPAVAGELLPALGPEAEARRHLTDRTAEADLRWGFPPHQVHHHNYGWALNGTSPAATNFDPKRPWGIGLQYAHEIAPLVRRIKDCPVTTARAASPPNTARAAPARAAKLAVPPAPPPRFGYASSDVHSSTASLSAASVNKSSTTNLSTAAPSDFGSLAGSDF